ncbi:DUF3846 domain-containing protein [Roseibium sediminicola]|uniref:DUF3846 domain-containing protein n=1 Tax=Roseibium sediminicola TaxID=2933272 RepID=A0ABT0H4G3_9HYPH|nr:hypothetical protein [Roseibium sp. CAU 1639]MCK7616182.1 hypothetical protein [Roseibium sp. CAU 1639]
MTNTSVTVTAFFYDSFCGAIADISLSKESYIDEVKQRIGCGLFDVVRINDHHDVFLDDNGLADGLHTIAHLKNFPNPLAGNLVIVGRDENGDIAEPRMTVEEIAALLTVYRPVMDPEMATLEGPDLIGFGLSGFQIRIEKCAPVIVVDGEF